MSISEKNKKSKQEIMGIEKTKDILTSRGGLALFVRYVSKIGIYPIIERSFGGIRKNKKGVSASNIETCQECCVKEISFHKVILQKC